LEDGIVYRYFLEECKIVRISLSIKGENMTNQSNCPSCGAPLKVKKNKTGESVCGFCGFQIASTKTLGTSQKTTSASEEFYKPDPPLAQNVEKKVSKVEIDGEKTLPAQTTSIPEVPTTVSQAVRNKIRIIIFVIVGLLILGCVSCLVFGLLAFPGK
jgi:uncharacterized Zn finger protein (UPF0148 family)